MNEIKKLSAKFRAVKNPLKVQETCDWFCCGSCVSSCGRCEYCDCPTDIDVSYYQRILNELYLKEFKRVF